MERIKRTWAEISLDALRHNVEEYQRIADGTPLMGIIKADGYGHGDVMTAGALHEAGVRFFGVSGLAEAICLRNGGVGGDILILGYTPPEQAELLSRYDITQTVYEQAYGERLSRAAQAAGVEVKCHVKIDTGMNRIGFVPQVQAVLPVYRLPRLRFTGIFTHFCCADEDTPKGVQFTKTQFARFASVIDGLVQEGIDVGVRHCCNTAAALRFPEMRMDLVRVGIGLYGLSPEQDAENNPFLQPAMTMKSVVSMLKTVQPGEYIGYGATYQVQTPMRVATVPVGYADGYPRLLSNKGRMRVGGAFAPVVGRVCMDQLMLDVTGLPVKEGDEVVVFGAGGPSADELARETGTINYEIVCGVSRRVPREYRQGGRIVCYKDYTL